MRKQMAEVIRFLLYLTLVSHIARGSVVPSASVALTDVQAAVNSASAGDTVTIPAGSVAWTSYLTVNKAVYLVGAGTNATIITNATSGSYLMACTPTNYPIANPPGRISRITFDLNNAGGGGGIWFGEGNKIAPFTRQTKWRIDHCWFRNQSSSSYQAIYNYGTLFGVVDHNNFESVIYPNRADSAVANSWWDNFGALGFGDATQNTYFEDNLYSGVSFGIISDAQYSGRYAYRYNEFFLTADAQPLFDMHGNAQGGTNGQYSAFGGEIYGNLVHAGTHNVDLLDQRGGKALVFWNRIETTQSNTSFIKVREEFADSDNPTSNTLQPQHISDSYYWNNRETNGFLLASFEASDCCGAIAPNVDYFDHTETFDGTVGLGVGPLGSRPVTCATGVGYFATSLSGSTVDGSNVGRNPTVPVSGSLYKATAPNVWSLYYAPLAYPHPLVTLGSVVDSTNPSYAEVLAAYDACFDGDTLNIKGPGTNEWGLNYLTITKAITITSSSTNSVKLTSTNGTVFFYLNASVPHFRLHDVYTSFVVFDQTTDRTHFVTGKTNNNIRIDHNRFDCGKRVIFPQYRTWGVVDHNDVYNCDVGFAPQGIDSRSPAETNWGDYSWSMWLANQVLGTTNDLVFESNYLHRDVVIEENEFLYGYAGGRATFRFNTVYSTNANLDLIDAHGWVAPSTTSRGTIGYEIYSNNIFCSASGRLMNLRGGTHLIYGNAFTSPQVGQASIELRDEGITSNGGIPSPYPDYHTNSFYWGNTWNGAAMTPNIIHTNVIILDQTVFFRPPTNSADKWFGYTPLVFPHPLVTLQDGGILPIAVKPKKAMFRRR